MNVASAVSPVGARTKSVDFTAAFVPARTSPPIINGTRCPTCRLGRRLAPNNGQVRRFMTAPALARREAAQHREAVTLK